MTGAGLHKAKAIGVKHGSTERIYHGVVANSVKAEANARNIAEIVADIEGSGVSTLTGVAKALEERGVKTPRGNLNWQATQVARIKAMSKR